MAPVAAGAEEFTPSSVLAAMMTMRTGDTAQKKSAHAYLEKFQKSKDAWTTIFSILESNAEPDAKLFAATTLKGKITYDVSTQVPPAQLATLRDKIIQLLVVFASGPKPIRLQLCVCLATLAIQMKEWKDVLPSVVAALGKDVASHAAILDFLRVLPEEVTEGRKINLTEDEINQKTTELLTDNADMVVQLLIAYAQSSASAAKNPQLMEAITSWLREIPVSVIANSPLLDVIFNALDSEQSFEAAADCLCAVFRETREVDECLDTVQILLPRVIALRPRIQKVAGDSDTADVDSFRALTKVFADAGTSWVVAIARKPQHFRPLVECVLECAARDKDREVIENTFNFWYELKQYISLDSYMEARLEFVDVYSRLVDIFLKHLEYPTSESGNEADLFDGDRELEEKFRAFRHQMGDTLKDACEVMGVAECLNKVLHAIQVWLQKYASQATATVVPHWQELEAPLFAMRAMGRMVDPEENVVLPQLMPLLVQIPSHEKLRFATIMVLGRYTEWTAKHPEFLSPQFSYVVSSFSIDSKEVIRAAAMAVKYFCLDCKHLLSDQVLQLQHFYDQILDKLPDTSQEEMTEGAAVVVGAQPTEEIYKLLKLYCDPLVTRLMAKANAATTEEGRLLLADHIQLFTIFVQNVVPVVKPGEENPAVKYWQEVFPILATVLENFLDFTPICERICRCWRFMIISYRAAMTPILPAMADKLATGFAESKQGCFLWVTGAILREFSEEREYVDEHITESIYLFFETQATNVLRVMSSLPPAELPDVIEDFFRLLIDALLFYPLKLIPSQLFTPIFQAAISALALEQRDPLSAALHYIRDVLTYGGDNPATGLDLQGQSAEQVKQIVRTLLLSHGELLIKQVMAGMMITFPRDCFADGSGVLLGMFELLPAQTTAWVEQTLRMLPEGTVSPPEVSRLMAKIREKLQGGPTGDLTGIRQVRMLLQDFTNNYRRRYVAPRDGLGLLEATRFRFDG